MARRTRKQGEAAQNADGSQRGDAARTKPVPSTPDELQRAYESSGYDMGEHPAFLIRRAHQRATMVFQQVMDDRSLTPTQMAALAMLMKHGSLSQNQLGRLCAMDPSTISIVIKKLLKQKLVERSGSDDDQRMLIIRLTEKGVRYTLPRLTQSVEVGRRTLSPLTKRQAAVFVSLLRRIAGSENDSG